MNLSCLITLGLAGVTAIAMVYYFFSEWNID